MTSNASAEIAALAITEERAFTARLNGRAVMGLAVAGAWMGLTKYERADGEFLIVLDAETRVVTGSAALIDLLGLAPKAGIQLNGGEVYVGVVDGQHVILLPGEVAGKSWADCMEWSKSIGGDLPTRAEQRLLFEKAKDHFEASWYWSSTQHANDSGYAWNQVFGYGTQTNNLESASGRARAVRRLPI